MFEDVFLAVYLSIVSSLVIGGAASLGAIAGSVALSLIFMAGKERGAFWLPEVDDEVLDDPKPPPPPDALPPLPKTQEDR